MIALLNLPKKGSEIFTIEKCKIETYYIVSIKFHTIPNCYADQDLSQFIEVELERYNTGHDSYRITKNLCYCFNTREELINQL